MRFTYLLDGSGWATASIELGDRHVDMAASYLRDSLREIALAVLALDEVDEATAVFESEPGEHHVTLTRYGLGIRVRVSWHADAVVTSGGVENGPERLVLTGETTLVEARAQLLDALDVVLAAHGREGYRRMWIEHDFPSAEHDALRARVTEA